MKHPHDRQKSAFAQARTLLYLLAILLVPVLLLHAAPPAWWNQRGATNSSPANDYAAANLGQLKQIVSQAAVELDAHLPGGAGTAITDLITSWQQPPAAGVTRNDYAVLNVGQLKAVAKPFYDRLIQVGYTTTYPWTTSTSDDNNYAAANLGQLKQVFSFDLTSTDAAHDTDQDGLPDWWEMIIYSGLAHDGTDDWDGDWWTDLQEWQQGTNAADYYNGYPPQLTIVSGGGQRGEAGTVLPVQLRILVNDGAYNAPVTLTVKSGHAQLTTASSAPSASVQMRSTAEFTDAQGWTQYVVQAGIQLPNIVGDISVIEATAGSGAFASSISTTAAVTDSSMQPPQNFTAVPNSPTSAQLNWTSSDSTKPTTVEISRDDGATWAFLKTVEVGTMESTVKNLTPNQTVLFRVYTGDNQP